MEKNLDERMAEIAARIEETRRIRRGLYAHLGERVFNQVVADPDLRNGKEEILGAIAACNRELGRLEDASASLDARMFAARQVVEGGQQMPSATGEMRDATDAPAGEPRDEAAPSQPVRDADGAPVVVAPLDTLEPAAAPDPVTLEPIVLGVSPATMVEMASEAATGPDAAPTAREGSASVAAQEAADVARDARDTFDADGAAPTIVLDRAHDSTVVPAAEPVSEPVSSMGDSDADAHRTCPVCGAQVAPDHRFCMNCGFRLDD